MNCSLQQQATVPTLSKRRPKARQILDRVSNIAIRHLDVVGRGPGLAPRWLEPEVADTGQRTFSGWSRVDPQEGRSAYRLWSFFI